MQLKYLAILLLASICLSGQNLDLSQSSNRCRISGSSTNVSLRGSNGKEKLLELRTSFSNDSPRRSTWDIPIDLDLSQSSGLKLRIYCHNPEYVTQFNAYLHTDGGWYGAPFEISANEQWEDVFIPKTHFLPENQNSSWKRCMTLRIAAWKGSPGTVSLFFSKIEFTRTNCSVAILRGTENTKVTKEAARHARNLNEALILNGLTPAIIDEADIAFQVLKPYSLVLLPMGEAFAQEQTDTIIQYIGSGGHAGVFHSMNPRLAAKMQMPIGKFATASKIPGAIGGLIPNPQIFPGLSPVRQLSQAFIAVENIPVNANSLCWWQSGDGTRTKWPSIIENKHGFWMTHIFMNQDPYNGGRLFVNILNHFDRNALQNAATELVTRTGNAISFSRKQNKTTAKSLYDNAKHALSIRDYGNVSTLCLQSQEQLKATASESITIDPNELRAIWCRYPNGLPGYDWAKTISLLSSSGLNAVFPIAACPHFTTYKSDVVQQMPGTDFSQCVNTANKNGFRVHAWINCLGMEDAPSGLLNTFRIEGRLQVGPNGETVNWLCPNDPRNRELLSRITAELAANFAVEGVHFDRIRYPGKESCYCDKCKKAFAKYAKVQLSSWPHIVRGGEYQEKWQAFRRQSINTLLTELVSSALTARKNIYISAAVYPDCSQARINVAQDWVYWCQKQLVSFVCPMAYHSSTAQFQADVKREIAQLGKAGLLVPGIGTGPSRLSADELARQITVTRNLNTYGFAMFDLGQREAFDLLPAIKQKGITR